MSKIPHTFILIVFFFSSLYSNEVDKQEIVWFQNQRPPWMMNSGEFRNQGYGDKIRQHFESILNSYNHKIIPINPSRFIKEMNKHNNLCYGPVMKVDFLKDFFYWSVPIYSIPKQKIILLESTFKKLGSPKEISIEELLMNQNYSFGKLANLNHYPIKKFKDQKNIQEISTMASTTNLLNMLQKRRIDWIYDLPIYIKWHLLQDQNIKNEEFKTIDVIETNKNDKIIAHMACIKNDFGKDIISKINKSITKDNLLEIHSYVRKWHSDKKSLDTFDRINKELFNF